MQCTISMQYKIWYTTQYKILIQHNIQDSTILRWILKPELGSPSSFKSRLIIVRCLVYCLLFCLINCLVYCHAYCLLYSLVYCLVYCFVRINIRHPDISISDSFPSSVEEPTWGGPQCQIKPVTTRASAQRAKLCATAAPIDLGGNLQTVCILPGCFPLSNLLCFYTAGSARFNYQPWHNYMSRRLRLQGIEQARMTICRLSKW